MAIQTKSLQKTLITAAALSSFIAGAALISTQAIAKEGFEKCAGIAKAGKNDCAANGHSCAAQSKKDHEMGEWVYVPTGTCDKIAGGSVAK